MVVMKHRSFFSDRRVHWGLRDAIRRREHLLDRAEEFINSIGAEKVVSVTAEFGFLGVTVWYREEAGDGHPQQVKVAWAEL